MALQFQVIGFFTDYSEFEKDGITPRPIDYVRYMPPPVSGEPPKSEVLEKVHRMDPKNLKLLPGQRPDDEKSRFFAYRWAVIGPAYEAWRGGQEIPLNGTPLAAWAGITPGQAELLKRSGIRTVQDFAGLSDSEMVNVRLPNARELQKLAQSFLDNHDAGLAAAREAEKDRKIEELQRQMAELMAAIRNPQPLSVGETGTSSGEQPDPDLYNAEATDEITRLRAQLDKDGIAYDKRWGAERLRNALNKEAA